MAVVTPKSGILSLFHTPIKNKAMKLKRDKVRNLNHRDLYKNIKIAKNIDKTNQNLNLKQ